MALFRTYYQTSYAPLTMRQWVKKLFGFKDSDLDTIKFDPADLLNYDINASNIIRKWNDEDASKWSQYVVTDEYTTTVYDSSGAPSKVTVERSQFNAAFDEITIRYGTELRVPQNFLETTIPFFSERTSIAPFKTFRSFVDDTIEDVIKDEGYVRSSRIGTDKQGNALNDHLLNITVLWVSNAVESFRLSPENIDGQPATGLRNKVFNLTPYVLACNTNVGSSGGNFSLSLAPISLEWSGSNWQLKGGANNLSPDGKNFFTDENNTRDTSGNGTRRNVYAFHHLVQPQDIIVIKFEELEMEREGGGFSRESSVAALESLYGLNIGRAISGDVLDMIGLVDSTNITENAESGDVSISVSGTDFSKMLLRDGAIFYPGAADNTIDPVSKYTSVWFLNNPGIRNSKSFQRLFTVQRINGQIQDINLYLNQSVKFWLEYIMTKLSTASVTLSDDFVGREDQVTVGENQLLEDYLNNDVPGIWKLTKLIVDPQLFDLRITDSTIAANSGSLMSFVKRVCQEPFVEFFTDTYGDRFYWIARKPPFNKQAFLDNHREIISEADLMGYSLEFNDSQVYSWYKLKPILWYQGDQNMSDFNFVSVFFPEFADIYGSRPLEVSSNYIDYGNMNANLGNGLDQAVNDMRWLIESNAHLVFTRRGTITINGNRTIKRGMCVYLESTDELFYVDSVSNSFQVSDTGTDRITTIQVSRGIVLSQVDRYFGVIDFAEDITSVATFKDYNVSEEERKKGVEFGASVTVEQKRSRNWAVNTENFYYLMQRKQFDPSQPISSEVLALVKEGKGKRVNE